MTEHTKLPWIYAEQYADNGALSHYDIIETKGGSHLAEISGGDCPSANANAAFIVKAANNHEKLVEIISNLTGQIIERSAAQSPKLFADAKSAQVLLTELEAE